MRGIAQRRGSPGARAAADDFSILDGGARLITSSQCARAVQMILDRRAQEFVRDRNSTCYRVRVSRNDESLKTVVVKVPRPGPQRTNADTTYAVEAAVLARLPRAGIFNAPRPLARVVAAGQHFLFLTDVPGIHPHPRHSPLEESQLRALLESMHAMDTQGLMHYDLQATNILLDADRAAFIDFEFAQFNDVRAAYAPEAAAWCADFNVSANPHFPARSNVANFEFRTLHRYLSELGAERSPAVAAGVFCDYLRARSEYHSRMAGFLEELATTSSERVAANGRMTVADAQRRLDPAAEYERLLARLLSEPHATVARVERAVMAYRCHVFEHNGCSVRRARQEALAALDAAVGTVPRAYDKATRATLDLIARSMHPPR